MLKYFRIIRKKLIEQDNVRKYLLYAIGEIILVVIGILIALNINNWNSNRIQKHKETLHLNNIERDLKDQLTIIEYQLAYESKVNQIATPIIAYYKANQTFKIDSIFTKNIGNLTGRKTFTKNAPTYTELISSGNIDIISNNALKDQIIKYYEELERIQVIINKNNNLFTDAVFIPEVINLSEVQMGGEFNLALNADYMTHMNLNFIDLNEPRLQAITKEQLEKPENELKMINLINFRNFLTLNHLNILSKLKKKTQILLKEISNIKDDKIL
ncbi:DUF6090 family protein [Planktosalinus lacus]|uniref:Uncharacterized protein n=1 Tax=Planktosalinus lacus TaxID=1526573 RepID=A0A8J2YCL8_9FLAO|nr:DUF6090 family protein [Planktosalinus lacus]GGE02027.1 hypothetical protein GCM10011312_26750 [Planktosalinus lacus]